MTNSLTNWANKHSKFVIIQPGDTVKAIYKGFTEGIDSYGDTIFYKLLVEGEETVKVWNQKSTAVARRIAEIAEGSTIIIERSEKNDAGKTTITITEEK